jgi:hypothetical protein
MAVFLSPVGGVAAQFFTNTGAVLTGGKIYTYAAGTTTPAVTYTTSGGATANTNPIVLDAAGRVPNSGEIWLADGVSYKFVLKDSNDVLIATYDNIIGINSDFTNFIANQEIQTATAGQTVFTLANPYTPGANTLSVFVDGVNQYGPGAQYAYFETNSKTVTFVSGLHVGASVKFTTVQSLTSGQATSAGLVSYTQGGTGAVATTVQAKLRQSVSVLDFGADPTGVADSTAAFDAAIATTKAVYVPAGTYLVNATINNKTVIYGDGSFVSILKPFNSSIAIMTYAIDTGDWYYHSEIRDVSFRGTAKVGVGFTFGQTVPANFVSGDETAHNVKFYGCYFTGLRKGVQFPFGNIGTEFYSCSWGGNYYGVYTMNNKFGNPAINAMHAGLKYFYSGYFGSNDVAFYFNNAIDGGGGVSFYSTTFEGNKIAAYIYSLPHPYTPIVFNDIWFEANGTYIGGTTDVDTWTGSTLTQTTITNRTVFIDGNKALVNFNGGFLTDIYVFAPNSRATMTNARVESSTAAVGGGPFSVNPSSILQSINPYTTNGSHGDGLITTGMFCPGNFLTNTTAPTSRSVTVIPRNSKIANYGPSRLASDPFTTSRTTSGALALVGTIVSDGVIYSTCNEWTRAAMTTSQAVYVSTTSVAVSAGEWCVATVDVKITAGAPTFAIDDQGSNILSYFNIPAQNKWFTIASIGQVASNATIALWTTGSNATCTWRHSAFQIHRFATLLEAQNFLMSCAYSES